ncbi:MAG: hypothetical protein E7057_10340, partial [Lentisphaerae bacterium]|nr:hypothetical protein [Lentisphaerota bacterium]
MEMLAKFIRMRTARSAATASHPCVEHATEGIKKKNPADVTQLSFLPSFFPKKASIKPRQRSGATVRFLCRAFFLVKESGLEGRDTAFPSPQTPHPQGSSRDSSKPLGSSIKLLRLRSRGECLWHSFRSLAAYCSSSAHP